MSAASLDSLLDELARRVAAAVVEQLRAGEPGMVDQSASPLGRRRHCAAVKRRLSAGLPGAAVVGRRHLLSRDALGDELQRIGSEPPGPAAPATGVRAELAAELRCLKGGRYG